MKVAADAKRKADTAAADEATAKKKKTAADAAAQLKKEDLVSTITTLYIGVLIKSVSRTYTNKVR